MRRKILHIILGGFLLGATAACEKDLPVYNYPENMLNFDLDIFWQTGEAKEVTYSFVYEDPNVTVDTVWVTVETMGFLSNQDRPFELQQVASGKKDAQPGVHYVAFDDPEVSRKYYYIPANEVKVNIPVIVKKDASLEEEDVALYFTFKENEYFGIGYPQYSVMPLTISNKLTKPAAWNGTGDYYFDTYGPVKHRFMIEVTGLRWDDDFMTELFAGDFGYIQYLAQLCDKKLKEENARRAEQGLGALAEDEAGLQLVTFSFGAFYNGD